VAEDNVVNQKVALRILQKFGYHADTVANGKEAVTTLQSVPYDLVLMDVQMPEMNGFEATQAIRDPESKVLRPDIPIIAMTAHALKGDREKCLEAGMDDYISKPVAGSTLNDMLEKHLRVDGTRKPTVLRPTPEESVPVNIQRLNDISDGDLAFEQELIESFLTDTEQHVVDLESAAGAKDGEEVNRQAHTIKGCSSNAGAERLSEIAVLLEQIVLDEEPARTKELVDDLKSEFRKVREYLLVHLESRHPPLAATAGS
jgi:CheY-like chemotaxis protein